MQNAEYSVALTHLVDKLKLENCTPNVPIEDVKVTQSDVNRPALQLAGFFDYFDSNRIQIIGQVEYLYGAKRCRIQCPNVRRDFVWQ